MKRLLLLFFLLISLSGFTQHQDKVDFIRGTFDVYPQPLKKEISGRVSYKIQVLQEVDSIFLDAKNMVFENVTLNAQEVRPHSLKLKKQKIEYSNDSSKLVIRNRFKKGKMYSLRFEYESKPVQTAYFLNWNDDDPNNNQVWTQGQGKYTSHWVPSLDDMNEKIVFSLNIITTPDFLAIANGKLKEVGELSEGTKKVWFYNMRKPMSSYLLAFVIGNYKKQELKSASGIPIENYYYPQDSLKVEPTYRYTKEIFDFLETEIGVPYPWQNYKQIPVRDFLYAGMENTTATIFSDQYMVDSTAFVDKNYVNVNAHELAHQWFGNLVTEKDGNHHWLHEGFATYYAYLAEQHLFGDDHFYWKLYKSLQELQNVVDRGEGQALVDPTASSLTFYEKGAWALFMLRNEIGDVPFKDGIKKYLEKHQFKNVTIDDFLNEMETTSGKSLINFREEWLEDKSLPFGEAKKLLTQNSSSIKTLIGMEDELKIAQSDDIDYQKFWNATTSIHLKKHLLKNYKVSMLFDGMKMAFESDTIPIRQTLLEATPINDFLPKEYLLDLLEENSYVTNEMALFQLWQGYPENRVRYLEKTKDIIGLPNKNVRLMWLTLAMLTEGFESLKTKEYFDELSGYTNPEYSFEIRQGAFFYLKEAFGFNDESLRNLVLATGHHSWQFRKFARNLLDELLKDEDYEHRLEKLSKELNSEETRYLNSKLNIE